MELSDYRLILDGIDNQLLSLFIQRMDISAEIAAYKREKQLPVLDVRREKEKLHTLEEKTPEEIRDYVFSLFSLILELSRSRQNRILHRESPETLAIMRALKETPPLFPEKAVVACQGVEGAYSGIACEKLFVRPDIAYYPTFESVFSAIEDGCCQYGVIPVENSTAGTVNAVYDLMLKHEFCIVRSVRVKVDHNLLVRPGTKLGEIREIYSHAQAIAQCSAFLQSMPNVKVIPCENTAVAAKMVAESEDRSIAALSSRSCSRLYGLEILKPDVQNSGNNHTRFICISKKLEIYPGADRTSLMMILPHEPGSLYKVLSRFYALGINLIKLESRPIPERSFEFMFYFDLDASVYSPRFIQLMGELSGLAEECKYLGSYSEAV